MRSIAEERACVDKYFIWISASTCCPHLSSFPVDPRAPGSRLVQIRWNEFRAAASCGWGGQQWGNAMISKRYLVRQARALISFAKSTRNPELAAVLVERAADLKDQIDGKVPTPDPEPQAPDVEPSPN